MADYADFFGGDFWASVDAQLAATHTSSRRERSDLSALPAPHAAPHAGTHGGQLAHGGHHGGAQERANGHGNQSWHHGVQQQPTSAHTLMNQQQQPQAIVRQPAVANQNQPASAPVNQQWHQHHNQPAAPYQRQEWNQHHGAPQYHRQTPQHWQQPLQPPPHHRPQPPPPQQQQKPLPPHRPQPPPPQQQQPPPHHRPQPPPPQQQQQQQQLHLPYNNNNNTTTTTTDIIDLTAAVLHDQQQQQLQQQRQQQQPIRPPPPQQQQWQPQRNQPPQHTTAVQQQQPWASALQQPPMGNTAGSATSLAKVELKLVFVDGSLRVYPAVSAGHQPWIDGIVQQVADNLYDTTKLRKWHVPLDRHEELFERLVATKRATVEPLAEFPLRLYKEAQKNNDDSALYDSLPTQLERSLYAFQREGVKFALKCGGRALIGDEMGLGKTIQAIAVVACYPEDRPCLILCPASLRHTWADALNEWLGVTDSRMCVVDSPKEWLGANFSRFDFVIMSYDSVQKLNDDISAAKFRTVICDEVHYLKSAKAKRTKACIPVIKTCRRAILLSGTPALAKPAELLTQVMALAPKAVKTQRDFLERYCSSGPGVTQWDQYGGACNTEELHALLKGCLMIRRLKNEVLTQLPKIQRMRHILALDESSTKMLADVKKSMDSNREALEAMLSAESGGHGTPDNKAMVMELYRESAIVKLNAVQEHIKELLQQAEGNQAHPYWKLIVFGHHRPMLDAVDSMCRKNKIKSIRIDGNTPSCTRQNLVNDFQNITNVRVAIMSIKAAGVGLTLTAASTVVFAEMSWTPGDIQQAEGRAHRIGQSEPVSVQFLIAKGTIDDLIWRGLQFKLSTLGNLLDGQQDTETLAKMEERVARGGGGRAGGSGPSSGGGGGPSSGESPGKRKRDEEGCADIQEMFNAFNRRKSIGV